MASFSYFKRRRAEYQEQWKFSVFKILTRTKVVNNNENYNTENKRKVSLESTISLVQEKKENENRGEAKTFQHPRYLLNPAARRWQKS